MFARPGLCQGEKNELMKELARCIRSPFFVVLDLEAPLPAKEVVVGIRCHGKVCVRRWLMRQALACVRAPRRCLSPLPCATVTCHSAVLC